MNVIGLCGFSGSGKTTLAEHLIAHLRAAGQRVSVVKHAHHAFDIDHEGKDSWRHRRAGAFEVVIASDRRLAKMREFEARADPAVHDLIAELAPCDWVLVEGFKRAVLPKIEVWRASTGKPAQYPDDPCVVAVATDDAALLPVPTGLPLLDLNDAAAIAAFLLREPGRFLYRAPVQATRSTPPGAASVSALAWRRGSAAIVAEQVADEVAVALEVAGVCHAVMRATPTDLEDFTLGFLLGEGIVDSAEDLLAVEAAPVEGGIALRVELVPRGAQRLEARRRALASDASAGLAAAAAIARAVPTVATVREGSAVVAVEHGALARGMRALAAGQALWRATGAIQAAAWISLAGELQTVREDVGRRNALDKLLGAMARAGVDPADGFVAVTSRVSHGMVLRAARAGVGLLAAISAPTGPAIRAAEQAGMALVGFARGDNATVYCHAARVRQGQALPPG